MIAIDITDNVNEAIKDFDKSLNQNHSAFTVDVSKSDQVESLFEKISEMYKNEKVPSIIGAEIFIHFLESF